MSHLAEFLGAQRIEGTEATIAVDNTPVASVRHWTSCVRDGRVVVETHALTWLVDRTRVLPRGGGPHEPSPAVQFEGAAAGGRVAVRLDRCAVEVEWVAARPDAVETTRDDPEYHVLYRLVSFGEERFNMH